MRVTTYKEIEWHCNCQTHDSPTIGCRDPSGYGTDEEFFRSKDLLRQLKDVWSTCPIDYIWDRKVPIKPYSKVDFRGRLPGIGTVELVLDLDEPIITVKEKVAAQIRAIIDGKIAGLRAVQAGV